MSKRVVFIATGGTLSCIGKDSHDLLDYTETDRKLDARQIVEKIGSVDPDIEVDAHDFRSVDSTEISPGDWFDLAMLCNEFAASPKNYDGIVIGHGTGSLEETAFALSLVLDLKIPVIVTGAMRPSNGMSSDGDRNVASSIRASASNTTRGLGVVALLNDEIHTAKTVTKTHSLSVNAFQSPGQGPIGHMVGNDVKLHTEIPVSRTIFNIDCLKNWPRIDITYSYAGADGAAIKAYVEAGAAGIIAAGFAPGMATPAEIQALKQAVLQGVTVIMAHRAAAGPATNSAAHRRNGFIPGGLFSPLKARILLGLSLANGDQPETIRQTFSV
ncbi:asparaginase [Pararhizobium sp. IMCC21322]|uniref:asparaginase n=1 Tax=Pararhizobium sp. IMCC21322 TaxID=3067903 RepID=UPI002740BAA3|nr:asparaginase [Pararhizobium sp. IMCC21322]